jgi:methylenetetrahydrofolate dehydrogenase (NADP+)/methenyltetrahydrofolate cyclohydrolase
MASYTVLDGKTLSEEIKSEIALEAAALKASKGITPHLAAILVGNSGASETYVNHKVKACAACGFDSTLLRFPDTISEADLVAEIEKVNANPAIHGLIVQLPLPAHINPEKVVETILPQKDVDGFHPMNVGRMNKGMPCFLPATPYGILLMLEKFKVETKGKHCVIVGRSQIVGSPMSILLSGNRYPGNCTVTLAHRYSENLTSLTTQADILVVATGIPGMIKADMVKLGAVVIDVGITRVDDATKKTGFAIKGDVAYEEVAPLCSAITPVPGGVGPMTIVALLKNTLLSASGSIY